MAIKKGKTWGRIPFKIGRHDEINLFSKKKERSNTSLTIENLCAYLLVNLEKIRNPKWSFLRDWKKKTNDRIFFIKQCLAKNKKHVTLRQYNWDCGKYHHILSLGLFYYGWEKKRRQILWIYYILTSKRKIPSFSHPTCIGGKITILRDF